MEDLAAILEFKLQKEEQTAKQKRDGMRLWGGRVQGCRLRRRRQAVAFPPSHVQERRFTLLTSERGCSGF